MLRLDVLLYVLVIITYASVTASYAGMFLIDTFFRRKEELIKRLSGSKEI